MITLTEHHAADALTIVSWFAEQGLPPIASMGSHLMVWSGHGWRLRMRYSIGVVYMNYDIDIDDADVLQLFAARWV